jgi:hypothetical protein
MKGSSARSIASAVTSTHPTCGRWSRTSSARAPPVSATNQSICTPSARFSLYPCRCPCG